jgi:ubiquinone/menaquinone biosynthesis C-methylase UbiE
MPTSLTKNLVRSTEAAWDRVAEKYRAELDEDIVFLRSGGVNIAAHEVRLLGDLSGCRVAVHLMCSHGQDALSLLNLGVEEVIGVDRSREMLALAARKSELLGARASWLHADVLDLPVQLDACADLVYTGKGALPWVTDLSRWAQGIARLLRPRGRLYVYEGHPLNWVWDGTVATHQLRDDGRGYFDRTPRANDDFPASAVNRYTQTNEQAPKAWEYQWTLGEVVTALCEAGLLIERVEEHAQQFWPKLRAIPKAEMLRLPHSFSVLARSLAA